MIIEIVGRASVQTLRGVGNPGMTHLSEERVGNSGAKMRPLN